MRLGRRVPSDTSGNICSIQVEEGSDVDKNSLELLLAQGLSVAQIAKRFGKNPSTVSYWMDKHGLEAPNRQKHAAKGGIERVRDRDTP